MNRKKICNLLNLDSLTTFKYYLDTRLFRLMQLSFVILWFSPGLTQPVFAAEQNSSMPQSMEIKPATEAEQSNTTAYVAGAPLVVQSGDTLSKIVKQVRKFDATLSRWLVAFFRANPDAFDGNNMNRLDAGKVLVLPKEEDVRALKQSEARSEVVSQYADYKEYFERLEAAREVRKSGGEPDVTVELIKQSEGLGSAEDKESASTPKLSAEKKAAAEKLAAVNLANEKRLAEKLEKEKAEAARVEKERAEAEQKEIMRMIEEKAAARKALAEKEAAERAAAKKAAAEKAAAEALAAGKVLEIEQPIEIIESEDEVLRFEIRSFTLDGGSLLSKEEVDETVKPYVGKRKDFSDVQFALEAIEALYSKRGYSAVHVLLPEQELELGEIHFEVTESRFGKIVVKNNKFIKFVSDENALNAIPSLRPGNIPRSKQIARELKLANENPARQLNVVLKAGETDDIVDANLVVTESKPGSWGMTMDNTGSPQTGRARMGFSYRHANLFDLDHVGGVQMQFSPEYLDRVKILGGSYKIPAYGWGGSADFSLGYSNVNSVITSTESAQGGGITFGSKYTHAFEKIWNFEPRLSAGIDYRDFLPVTMKANNFDIVIFKEMVVTPVSLAYSLQGQAGGADVGFNTSATANLPVLNKGKPADFERYDPNDINKLTVPTAAYKVLRLGGSYAQQMFKDWQFRTAFNAQWSGDLLIQGEQLRLGGSDGVRGFSEGSEGGEKGVRGNFEVYTPDLQRWNSSTRGLIFLDMGTATTFSNASTTIVSTGVGVRSSLITYLSLRADIGVILKAANDPQQQAGDWRAHLGLSANY